MEPEQRPADHASGLSADIRQETLGLLIVGAVSLYLGFSLPVDWPASATPAEVATWQSIDVAFNWGLRVIGVAFLGCAALTYAGQRIGLIVGAVAGALLAVLMVVMGIEWYIEDRISGGGFNPQIILLLVLAVISLAGARRAWVLYRVTALRRDEAASPFEPPNTPNTP